MPASDKVRARALVVAALREYGAGRELWVRVNCADFGLLEEDIAAVVGPELAGVVLPKAASPGTSISSTVSSASRRAV